MLRNVIEQIENRSMEKGRQEGQRAAAVRMLRKGFAIDDVVEVTELSSEEVAELARLKANSPGA